LQDLDVFHAIQLQRLGDLAENAVRDLEALVGQLKNTIFRFEITRKRDEDRHDEPAKKAAENEQAEIF
jgi:hypothetical protein